MEECMIGVEPQVMNEMNQVLLAKFTKTDVETALGQMQPMKYLGPDGFTIGFFQNTWSTVKKGVCGAMCKGSC
jgi:hypothetical protein